MTLTLADGTPVSRAAYGAMQWGGRASEDDARAMYDAARAAGISHFDTAVGYTDGRSEEILGRIARPDRDRLYIATKCASGGSAAPDVLRQQWEQSRSRLGMDRVDLLYLHRFDPETPLEATYETMAELKSKGAFRHLGVSNYAAWQVMKARTVAAQFDLTIDAIQPMYNLVKRQAEVEILPMAASEGIAVFPYSPLGGGLLTGKYAGGGATGRLVEDGMYNARYAPDWMHRAAEGLSGIAAELGTHPATLAVAWILASPFHPMPIVSARSAEQLAPSLAGLSFEMTADLNARLSALVPAPPPATDRLEEG